MKTSILLALVAMATLLGGCGLLYSEEEITAMNPPVEFYNAQARAAEAAAKSVSENYVVITGSWTCNNPNPENCKIEVKNPVAPNVPAVVQGYGAAQALTDQTASAVKGTQVVTGIVGAAWFAAEALSSAGDTTVTGDGNQLDNNSYTDGKMEVKGGGDLITGDGAGDGTVVQNVSDEGRLGADNRGQYAGQYYQQNQGQNALQNADLSRPVDVSVSDVNNPDRNNSVDNSNQGNTATTASNNSEQPPAP